MDDGDGENDDPEVEGEVAEQVMTVRVERKGVVWPGGVVTGEGCASGCGFQVRSGGGDHVVDAVDGEDEPRDGVV